MDSVEVVNERILLELDSFIQKTEICYDGKYNTSKPFDPIFIEGDFRGNDYAIWFLINQETVYFFYNFIHVSQLRACYNEGICILFGYFNYKGRLIVVNLSSYLYTGNSYLEYISNNYFKKAQGNKKLLLPERNVAKIVYHRSYLDYFTTLRFKDGNLLEIHKDAEGKCK